MKIKATLLLLFVTLYSFSQTLTISNVGQIGVSGTNWTTSGTNPVTITATGTADINTSVITGYLSNNKTVKIESIAVIKVEDPIIDDANGILEIMAGTNIYLNASLQAGSISILADESTFVNTNNISLTTNIEGALGGLIISSDANGDAAGTNQMERALDIETNGGNVTIGGGNEFGTLYGNSNDWFGIEFTGLTINTNSGDVQIRGESDNAAALRFGGTGVQITTSGGNIYMRGETENNAGIYFEGETYINSGSGTIYLEGNNTTSNSDWGILTNDSKSHSFISSNTTQNAIKFLGYSENNKGLDLRSSDLKIHAIAEGGGIILEADGGSSSDYGILLKNAEILSVSGTILLDTKKSVLVNELYVNGDVFLGSKSGTAVPASSANIIVRANDFQFNQERPAVATIGSFTLEPVSSSESFDNQVFAGWFNWNQNNQIMSGLVIGSAANLSDISINSTLLADGSISIYGSAIDVTSDITTTNGDILLDADIGTAISMNDDGVYVGPNVTLKTQTSGDIYIYGRSGNANSGGQVGISTAGTDGAINITSAGNITMLGISESASSSGARGTYFNTTSMSAVGDVTILGQGLNDGNDYDISFQNSTIDAGGKITLDAQNGGRINFSATNTLTAVGDQEYFANNIGLNINGTNTINGSGTFTFLPDTDSSSFTADINISPIIFGSSLTGFSIGDSQNTTDLTVGALDLQGPISLYGTDIEFSSTVVSSDLINAIGNLEITSSGSLTLNSNAAMTVNGNFTNNGVSPVTLHSDSDEFSSLLVSGAASGDITYNRYVNIVGDGEWDLIGAPVSGMAFSSLITDTNIATNGSFYAVGSYDNTMDTWTNATDATTGNLALGQGYQMATTSGGTLSFTGAIANGDQTVTITNSDAENSGAGRRWNLIANPFPSYLNANDNADGPNNF